MLHVKYCSDRIQPSQYWSSVLRSLYNKRVSGAINPEGDLPPLLTLESNGKPALCTREHQSEPAEAPSEKVSISTAPLSAQKRDQYQTQPNLKGSSLWCCERPSKAFQTGHQGEVYKALSHWARWRKGFTQGVLHSPSSLLNQTVFFPLQCNWKALISASRTGKMTDLKHFPQQCLHLFLINLLHMALVPHLQCRTICWDTSSSLF